MPEHKGITKLLTGTCNNVLLTVGCACTVSFFLNRLIILFFTSTLQISTIFTAFKLSKYWKKLRLILEAYLGAMGLRGWKIGKKLCACMKKIMSILLKLPKCSWEMLHTRFLELKSQLPSVSKCSEWVVIINILLDYLVYWFYECDKIGVWEEGSREWEKCSRLPRQVQVSLSSTWHWREKYQEGTNWSAS